MTEGMPPMNRPTKPASSRYKRGTEHVLFLVYSRVCPGNHQAVSMDSTPRFLHPSSVRQLGADASPVNRLGSYYYSVQKLLSWSSIY